jgi:hypothetical protein
MDGPRLSETELLMLQVVVRHGDRTPTSYFPGYSSSINESNWSDRYGGLGQLTQIGIRQQYDYGQYLKREYSRLFNRRFDLKKVNAKSTNYDRTIMSASSLLSGLFIPTNDQVWNKDVKWQPIPVHIASGNLMGEMKCEKLEELFEAYTQSDEFKKLNDKYKDFFDLVKEKTGQNDVSLRNILNLCDNVYVQVCHISSFLQKIRF